MMARSLTANMITEITADTIKLAFLVKMEFDSSDERLWTGYGDLTFNSEIYTGAGQLLEVTGMHEVAADIATGMTLVMAGELSSLIAIALAEKYMGRRITVWIAAFDANESIIADPSIVFRGKMDTMNISSNGKRTRIVLNSESDMIRLERASNRRYNDEDQQREFSGDLGFEFLPFITENEIRWGAPNPTASAPNTLSSFLSKFSTAVPPPPPMDDNIADDFDDDGD